MSDHESHQSEHAVKIRVIYKEVPSGAIKFDADLDKKIQDFFEGLGFEWTGQGFDLRTNERDISFVSEERRLCCPPEEGDKPEETTPEEHDGDMRV